MRSNDHLTVPSPSTAAKRAISVAPLPGTAWAPGLQRLGGMRALRNAVALLALVAVLVGGATTARAQTGTCTGNGFAGTVGLAVQPLGNMGNIDYSSYESVAATSVGYVFNGAECNCHTADIALDIYLGGGMALGLGSTGSVEVWVGTGCDNDTTRTTPNQTQCQQVPLSNVTIANFSLDGATVNGHIYIPIPSQYLMAPKSGVCPTTVAGNDIYLFIFSGSNISPSGDPYASCELDLTEQAAGPIAATSFAGESGDGAINLSWQTPATTTAVYYQVLCANLDGTPIAGKSNTQVYTTCLPPGGPGDISRRQPITGGSLGIGDAGTISTLDLALDSATVKPGPKPSGGARITPDVGSLDGGVTDGGTPDLLTPVDLAGVTTPEPTESGLPPPFDHFDPSYACTAPSSLPATSGSASQGVRVSGLTNGQTYQFALVAVDAWGNPTAASNVVTGTPEAVEDLYRRYRDDGGSAHGFCFIATATYGSYEHRYVRVLRLFRDEALLPTAAGRAFVAWYYRHSPPAAQFIARHSVLRAVCRVVLLPLIGFAALWLFSPLGCQLFLLLLIGLWVRRRMLRANGARRPVAAEVIS